MTTVQQFYSCDNDKCVINTNCKNETSYCYKNLDDCNSECSRPKGTKPDSVYHYCQNPSNFKGSLTEAEIISYNSQCENLSTFDKFSDWSADTIKNLVDAMIDTTTGREMLAIILFKGALEKGITKYGMRLAFNELITDKLITTLTKEVTEIGIKEVGVIALSAVGSCLAIAAEAALISLEIALPFLAPIEAALQMFMLLGMLIDAWDPCDLQQQIGPQYLNAITKQYNMAFVNAFASTQQNTLEEDLNKRLVYRLGIWPIEYYIDNTYISDAVKSINKTDQYDTKRRLYQTLYLKYAVEIPKLSKLSISAADFKNLNDPNDIFYQLSNKNSIVEKFFKNYWVYIIIVIIILIILIIFIIHKLNKNVI